ncbi:methyltransferase domain-containing protein [Saccharopolyspora cebuensis]|uniref:Methyltransferase domain-containing protein n=1 Tax=Saccharopolyspora cebuensis TaxID=418759 RepID=A0ABV4CLC6_9PSEU
MSGEFDPALRAAGAVLELDDGSRAALPVQRWCDDPDPVDLGLIDRCTGPTLDIGCGPGRFTSALRSRGIPALGIDVSPEAVRMTLRRGGVALRRDVFEPLPDEGRWRHVLLVDGNLGIGGDPAALLRRVRALLDRRGHALVEVAAPGAGLRTGFARLDRGPWFPWAEADAAGLAVVAARTGLVPAERLHREHRWFVDLLVP